MRVRVRGTVQGVGYRPFAYALAAELGVAGFVGNDPAGVFAEAEGPVAAVAAFVAGLRDRAPVLAVVEDVTSVPLPPVGRSGFVIVPSAPDGPRLSPVSADAATCADCLVELWDPADRRYRYPFVNCTNCGPRFTVVTGVPYDRPLTTMAGFRMCADCAREYADPADRRFHAQPVCCPACGPALSLVDGAGRPLPGDPVAAAADVLAGGGILAVKGLGGYHLAVDAAAEPAVAALRERKHREERPLAVMAADLATAGRLVELDPTAVDLLTGRRRPIVLLPRRPDAPLAPSVAPGNRDVGLMLPYTPLHHLLAAALGRPFVLTSGNVSDEPIAYADDDAATRLAGIADAVLRHDRTIHTRVDDSVVRVTRGRATPIRRSRGYAPEPLSVPWPARRPVLGCGAELKSTFCLLRDRHAVLSQHIGDLENWETYRSYVEGIEHYRRLFDVEPALVAHDLHPDYLSTAYALEQLEQNGVEAVGVQHHHAHIASCLADNGATGPVIGLALDGTGFGPDGTLWGGEVLIADLTGFRRAGHLAAVPLPGGTAAIREPWRMAAAYLGSDVDGALPVRQRHAEHWPAVVSVGARAVLTSSAGRLFDAVAAVAGVRDRISYEGQAAIELEQRVDPAETGGYEASVVEGVLSGADLVRAAAADVLRGVPAGVVAARFHRGLADGLVALVEQARDGSGLSTVALSGGVVQNVVLLTLLTDRLAARGCTVLTHSRVPPNDAGISFGQAVVAAARDRGPCQDGVSDGGGSARGELG
ncbi:MAG TPA: carbamoyltransferase HypF [Mycobacteriales bacterium]|nr:carbamoyltransferase HypF [Mycobacteriales bacterium]